MKMSAPKEPSPETQEGDYLSQDEQVKVPTAKPAFHPLSLLKEEWNQIKGEVKTMFKDKDSDPTPGQSAEKRSSPLTVLKEELSNVFRIGPSRDQENKISPETDDSRNNPKTKASRAERTDEPFKSLFRREKSVQKTAQRNHTQEAKPRKADLETYPTKRNKEPEKTEQSTSTLNSLIKPEVSEPAGCGSERRTERMQTFASTPQSETMFASQTAEAPEKSKTNQEDEPLEKTPLSTEISLFPLRTNLSCQPTEDFWSLKNSAIYLTFDPNTANSELCLANGNRKATRDWLQHRSTDHPERFKQCPQVLCREGLLDLAYWEVSWSGGVDIGVTYNSISRDGDTASCLLGHNEQSWSLECSDGFYTPCHNNRRFRSSSPQPFTNRVGIYLDCPAGRLSFFCVSRDAMVHLHTFTSTFTQPLYGGFWVWATNGSVTLHQVELDWERLL